MEEPARTPRDTVDKLHEEAGKVQETLKGLLEEIKQLLEKTKRIIKDMDQPESRSKPES